jgi:hypothetical protein
MATVISHVKLGASGRWSRERGTLAISLADGETADREEIQRRMLPGSLLPFGLETMTDSVKEPITTLKVRPGALLCVHTGDVEIFVTHDIKVKKEVVLPTSTNVCEGSLGVRVRRIKTG